MFDAYSQLRSEARALAFSKPETLPTWPDMIRQSRKDNFEVRLYKAYSEAPLFLFAAGLMPRFLCWQSNLWRQPARRVRVHRHYLPPKRHSPVHR